MFVRGLTRASTSEHTEPSSGRIRSSLFDGYRKEVHSRTAEWWAAWGDAQIVKQDRKMSFPPRTRLGGEATSILMYRRGLY